MTQRKSHKISSWTWIKKAYPLVIRESFDNDSRIKLKNPFILFVISLAYSLLSEEERQSLWPCNTISFSLKMSLYKRCIFMITFQQFDVQCLLLVISALCIAAWNKSRLCIDDWTYWSVWSRCQIKIKCPCGSGTDSKVSLTIIPFHSLTGITDISWKHFLNTH